MNVSKIDPVRPMWACLILIALVLGVYSQVLQHDFINFDDDGYITGNPRIEDGLTKENILWAFTASEMANWHPLTWLSYLLDLELWGMDGGLAAFHNVVFHGADAILLFFILMRVGAQPTVALILSAIWAIHPVNVESVAWISQRKTVLSTFFLFLGLLAYFNYASTKRLIWHVAVSVCLIMSLLAKPMAVTLPAMLLVLDGYPLRRIDYPNLGSWRSWLNLWPLIREKLLWIAIVAAFCAATLIAQKEGGAVVQLEYLPLESRIENAVYSYVRYLLYLVIPLNLGLMYYYRPGTVEFLMAAFVLAGICILFLRRWRTIPALATGWALYLGTLVPVIGIVQVGSQSMADRYMYVPMIGLLISLIPVFEAIQRRIGRGATVGGATMVLVFSLLAWFQTSLWKDSALIFEHTIRHSGPHPAMLNNLSVHFLKNGRPEISLFHLNRLLENHRDFGPAYANLGIALVSLQREAEGVEMLRIAVELEPDRPRVKLSYALALIRAGQVERAMELLRTTKEEFGPNERYNLSMVHYYLGLGYDALGDLDKALAEYQISLRLMQRHPELLNDLGTLLLRLNRPREALRMTQRSVILNPNAPEPLFNLAGLYKHLGNSELAETTYQETIRRFPRFHPARTALAALYLDQNLPDQALATIQPIRSHTNYLVRREVALLTLHANRLVNHTTSAEEIEDFKTRFPEETHLLERLQEHWTRMGM